MIVKYQMFTGLEETVCKFSIKFNSFSHQELSPAVKSNTNVNSCFASISIIYNVHEIRILSSSHVGLKAAGRRGDGALLGYKVVLRDGTGRC